MTMTVIRTKPFQFFLKTQLPIVFRTFSVVSPKPSIPERFHGKTAVVTGSTAGIGLATARRFALEGANVVICSRNQTKVDQALASLHQEGLTKVTGVVCDVGQKKDRDGLINHTISKNPQGIDVLVSNAAAFLGKPVLETTSEEWDHLINMNLKSHSLLSQEALPYIRKRGGGSIVYISTAAAYVTVIKASVYAVAKTGMLTLTKMAAAHLAPENIRVNCVVPGLIDTEMAQKAINEGSFLGRVLTKAAVKRVGAVEDVSGVVAFLSSDDASYITGERILVTGGVHARL